MAVGRPNPVGDITGANDKVADNIITHAVNLERLKSSEYQKVFQLLDKLEIDFITFDDLVNKYDIHSIDNLQIDVEGAEFEILNSIDFQKININSIQFESKHFDGTFSEGAKLENMKQKLKKNGFNLTQLDEENILAKR